MTTPHLSIGKDDWLTKFIGEEVVIDLAEHYLAIGTLHQVSADHITMVDADLHDHREANSTKEVYLIETQKFGIRVNRRKVDIPRRHLIAISKLGEVAGS